MAKVTWPRDSATEQLLTAYKAYEVGVAGIKARNADSHVSRLRGLAHWMRVTGRPGFTQLSKEDIVAWLISEEQRGIGARSRQDALAILRGFLDWLLDGEVNPAREVPMPRTPPPSVLGYSQKEVDAILGRACRNKDLGGRFDYIVLATLRFTGIRVSELTNLRCDQLDLTRRRAQVIGKGDKPRVIPLPEPLAELLGNDLEDVRARSSPFSEHVFANPRVAPVGKGFGRIDPQGVAAICRSHARAANVSGPNHPHRWRHTYATELVRAGMDLHVVQRLLGHAELETTVRYLHLQDGDLRNAIDHVFGDE